jgi:hypothetical protein
VTELMLTRQLRGDHCQCGGCGLYFNSTYAFDRHRVTERASRRCLTVAEMLHRNMAQSLTGWWTSGIRAVDAPVARACDSRSGDRPEDVDRGAEAATAGESLTA